MELKFNIIKPNLYTLDDEIYFGIYDFNVMPVSRFVDELVKKNIGDLKVQKSHYEVARSPGRLFPSSSLENYTIPLSEYIDILQEQAKRFGQIPETVNNIGKLFNLGYIIDAQTIEDFQDAYIWSNLKKDLVNPEKTFDHYNDNTLLIIDREKTLEKMKKLYEELNSKILDNYAEFGVINGEIGPTQPKLGIVKLLQLKAENRDKIEETKVQLIERLKEIDGPCLSFDAPNIYGQAVNLFNDAPELIQRCGDVVLKSQWRQRLFRLSP